MLDTLAKLVRRRPTSSPEERAQVLAYYEKSLSIIGLQTREADRYNSALLIHGNRLADSESVKVMLDASKRLSLCAHQCLRRHSSSTPSVPELATEDYAAWGLLYMDYSAWASAQHDTFVAISRGRTPVAGRVQDLMTASERARKIAEREGEKLLQAVGLKRQDVQRFIAAQEGIEIVDWEPERAESPGTDWQLQPPDPLPAHRPRP